MLNVLFRFSPQAHNNYYSEHELAKIFTMSFTKFIPKPKKKKFIIHRVDLNELQPP